MHDHRRTLLRDLGLRSTLPALMLATMLGTTVVGCVSYHRSHTESVDAGMCYPSSALACVEWDLRACTDGHGFDCVICTPTQWNWCEIPSTLEITGGRDARAKCVDRCTACTPPESKIIDPKAVCVMYDHPPTAP